MERRVERIDGVKLHLNRLTDEELANVRSFLTQRLVEISVELELIDGIIHENNHEQLPLDYEE